MSKSGKKGLMKNEEEDETEQRLGRPGLGWRVFADLFYIYPFLTAWVDLPQVKSISKYFDNNR